MMLKRISFLLIFAITSLCSSIAQENVTYILHTIEKGQSLYSIAAMYNLPQADIIRLNPGCDQKIIAGQALKIPKRVVKQNLGETFHTIQAGETLYRLTALYQISAKEICDANPGISEKNFRTGQVIRIPQRKSTTPKVHSTANATPKSQITPSPAVESKCKEMHKVKRRETIFSVSRKYGISERELREANPELANGMKKGQLLCIPYSQKKQEKEYAKQHASQKPLTDKELFESSLDTPQDYRVVKAAVLLPFMQDQRMVEYYEGLLLAVDSLKRTGTSIDLYAYNCESSEASLNSILAKKEMKDMHVIFGPVQNQHAPILAKFAKKHKIRLVIPFSSKRDEVFNNPYVYQVNTPQSYLFSEVYDHFLREFTNSHIIFVQSAHTDKNKTEFIHGLKEELKHKNIQNITILENATSEDIKQVIKADKANLFIPTSGDKTVLTRIIPQLTAVVKELPDVKLQLFGYPEWQTYTDDFLQNFFELDTYFYSSFYTNNLFPSAINFTKKYNIWYSKDMIAKYPKYGMLGYDTAFFFLKGLSLYGSEMEDRVSSLQMNSIQTGFKFLRVNNWGGFINKKVFFIHFTKDFEVVKLDFD